MPESTSAGIGLVIVGVLLIVIGGWMVLSGWDQVQAANAWDENVGCAYDYRSQVFICPDNPYDGGRSRLWTGVVVCLIGGVILYYGTR